jgi:excisionase family DNA binding protein
LLKSISLELFVEHEKLNEEPGYSNEVVNNRVKLCEKFITAVKKCKLPVLTELWWFYEYQFLGNSMELNLCQADEVEIENDEISGMTAPVEHTLITVECDYLTVEQYASMLGIEPVTVRQWIRRGKLRHAKKNGRDWLIPNTEDKPRRGFTSVQYIVEKEVKLKVMNSRCYRHATQYLSCRIKITKANSFVTLIIIKLNSKAFLNLQEVKLKDWNIQLLNQGKQELEGISNTSLILEIWKTEHQC